MRELLTVFFNTGGMKAHNHYGAAILLQPRPRPLLAEPQAISTKPSAHRQRVFVYCKGLLCFSLQHSFQIGGV